MTDSTSEPLSTAAGVSGRVYDRIFWMSYCANIALVTANAITFRFAELVAWLGGTEQLAGFIVSVGVFGAIVARLFLGQAIDRYGTRQIWLMSSAAFVTGSVLLLVGRDLGFTIYIARIAFTVGLAGNFTCSVVHIQNHVPAHRRTEVIGNLGSSGFVGMIAGSQLGDLIFRLSEPGQTRFVALFGGAAVLGLVYAALVSRLSRNDLHSRPRETPAAHRLLFRFWPGPVVGVALMMGMCFTVTTVFLTRYATHLGVEGIGTFWTGYAVSAFVFRILTQNWSRTVGRHRMIVFGLTGHAIGHAILIVVGSEIAFAIPAVFCGFGHALLFPAVVSLGAGSFPREYRGTGTTLVLGFFDIGSAVFAPVLGGIIDAFSGVGFVQMFMATSSTSFVAAVAYGLLTVRAHDDEREPAVSPTDAKSADRFETPDVEYATQVENSAAARPRPARDPVVLRVD